MAKCQFIVGPDEIEFPFSEWGFLKAVVTAKKMSKAIGSPVDLQVTCAAKPPTGESRSERKGTFRMMECSPGGCDTKWIGETTIATAAAWARREELAGLGRVKKPRRKRKAKRAAKRR